MKNSYPAYSLFFSVLSVVVQLTGCGLRYAPPASPQLIAEERRFALQEQLNRDFSSIGKKYTPLTFGELVVVKPDSYRKLDSLYNIKYRSGSRVRPELASQIEAQLAIISNDTTPILYVETHWYELAQDSVFEYLTSEISMKKNHAIVNVKNLDYFQVPKKHAPYARRYMREESILSSGMAPLESELAFYTLYKTRAASLAGDLKDAFMEHTFRIMQLAEKSRNLSTDALLRAITSQKLKEELPELNPANLTFSVEEISDNASGRTVFAYYLVTVSDRAGKNAPLTFKYNAYLEEIQ